jgi:hypothetical protein
MEYSMAKFTEAELRDILNSDMKLWERAHAGPVTPEFVKQYNLPEGTQGIVKEIDCPLVGGKECWVFPADEKQYVEQFGPTVRDVVKEIKDEQEELAARNRLQAEFRAQEALEAASAGVEDGGPEGGTAAIEPVLSQPVQEAGATPEDPAPLGASLADRRDALTGAIITLGIQIQELSDTMRKYEKEAHAINAALEIMNAPEDDGAQPTDVQTETIRTGPGDSVGEEPRSG